MAPTQGVLRAWQQLQGYKKWCNGGTLLGYFPSKSIFIQSAILNIIVADGSFVPIIEQAALFLPRKITMDVRLGYKISLGCEIEKSIYNN